MGKGTGNREVEGSLHYNIINKQKEHTIHLINWPHRPKKFTNNYRQPANYVERGFHRKNLKLPLG